MRPAHTHGVQTSLALIASTPTVALGDSYSTEGRLRRITTVVRTTLTVKPASVTKLRAAAEDSSQFLGRQLTRPRRERVRHGNSQHGALPAKCRRLVSIKLRMAARPRDDRSPDELAGGADMLLVEMLAKLRAEQIAQREILTDILRRLDAGRWPATGHGPRDDADAALVQTIAAAVGGRRSPRRSCSRMDAWTRGWPRRSPRRTRTRRAS